MIKKIENFQYDNLNLEYLKIDNSKDKNLIFVHGFSSEFNYFTDLFDNFSDYNIYGLNMPGHGKSEFNFDKMNLLYFKDIFINFVNSLNIKNITLIGHSMGGGIAMMVVPQLKKIIDKIILVGPMSRSGLSRVQEFEECFFPRNIKDYEKLVNLCYYDPNIILLNSEIMNNVSNYLKTSKSLDAVYKLGHSLPNLENMDSIETGLKSFDKPLLLIYGEADGIIDLQNIDNYYLSCKSDVEIVVIKKSGHSIWKENKKDFIDQVNRFLSEK
ncbi:hypothetical protein C4M98_00475 [Mycoplasmopsis pullorum]|uniref:alpha/beta fold hydrolase n=1 Tax=Mycoplasmopsis pullorum TaxID=48003 RepID=UPI00111983D3|nr:alpha/beta hydrolase [Mycoplasmopsis pullorum]TNK82610.1 hypothetical protein C4M94_00300 [Mycoplasmopsis pullorum]TNK83509.1 hypothetical protein C4M80_00125 [Mycoplasmopsis pullorum]TNK84933.1 hypothetical protein C4M81_00815 [Mycoplasmopsis pullorum]TNK85725.1 hypothetical protein C4M92_00340 [Mycoplasmopsis pullorum]TNK86266.1 hypothetical protein C4M85_00510 [Mycoplasmopsis pullorum]